MTLCVFCFVFFCGDTYHGKMIPDEIDYQTIYGDDAYCFCSDKFSYHRLRCNQIRKSLMIYFLASDQFIASYVWWESYSDEIIYYNFTDSYYRSDSLFIKFFFSKDQFENRE